MKPQNIRLFDVFVLGPAMIYAGTRLDVRYRDTSGLGPFMAAMGIATIVYNGRNYLRAAKG